MPRLVVIIHGYRRISVNVNGSHTAHAHESFKGQQAATYELCRTRTCSLLAGVVAFAARRSFFPHHSVKMVDAIVTRSC